MRRVTFALFLLSCGCFDFDKQSFVVILDEKNDEAHALLIYEGIRAPNSEQRHIDDACTFFTAFFEEGKGLYVGHNLLLVEMKPILPRKKPAPSEEKWLDTFSKHIKMTRAGYFVDGEGRLCAFQEVHIKELKKFVAGINEAISLQILETAVRLPPVMDQDEAGSRRIIEKAAKDKFAWVRIEQGRIRFTVLGTPATLRQTRTRLAEDLLLYAFRKVDQEKADAVATLKQNQPQWERLAAFLGDVPLSVEQHKDRLILSLGLGENEPIRLYSPYLGRSKGPVEPLLEHAKKSKVEQIKNGKVEGLTEEFIKKHQGKK